MTSRPRLLSVLSAGVAGLLLAGCAVLEPAPVAPTTPTATYTRVTAAPTAYQTQKRATAFGERCRLDDEKGLADLTIPGRGEPPTGAVFGSGATVAFLLPGAGQTACDLVPITRRLQEGSGVRIAPVDVCPGDCAAPVNPVPFAKALAAWARSHGAKKVIFVGGDTGASMAMQVADDVKADAVVAISAPAAGYPGAALAADARKLTMPTLFLYDPSLDPADFKAGAAAFATIPSKTKRLWQTNSGHGWELLSNDEVAVATVRSYLRGAYATS